VRNNEDYTITSDTFFGIISPNKHRIIIFKLDLFDEVKLY